ncbi:hypothetical protein M406DRAFT_355452 [Cryphonectria parasitica EP155]|uniref:SMP-30/Gluconolactonase/LRE-like region domain-containing protein n=1 Tax=Cryphonectria parasitica (strain ATCC 38755 / EP155) TaxID=660469 RepID=A0A9P4Y5F4_CRYP1|nr:uncharacterized protein M406DRAFT_355452 [Cryphonectria parasitica EP155]KAF3767053.1 hypothetical protein M406DRAFT_355452 [Cryphonectria parasitica EP155]
MRQLSDPVSTLYEFPWDTYVENLAVRPNGQILVNPLTLPQLYLVEPRLPGEIFLVYEFPEILGLSGIVEYQPDVFAVVTGNFSLSTGDSGAGTWAVWSIDLGGVNITSNDTVLSDPPQVKKIADIPEATFLNGLTVLSSAAKQLLLVGDVKAGTIYSLDPDTGHYAVAINNTYTAAADLYAFGTAGTDGMKVRDEILYFDNPGQGILVKVPLDAKNGTPAGDFEVIAKTITSYDQWDDFTFDCEGNIFMATGGADTVQRIDDKGHVQIIAGNLNSTAISEATSTKFGRREDDADVLYVTTGGGAATPVNGDIVIGGQVLAIKTGTKGSFC